MGHITHHAIIVTGQGKHLKEALTLANKIFPDVSPILPSVMNGYETFFVPPDGSKEGWQASKDGDKRRAEFFQKVDPECVRVAIVQYADDGGISWVKEGKPW
jgi:hypothetical protein